MKPSQMLWLLLMFIAFTGARAQSEGLAQSQHQANVDICHAASATCVAPESPESVNQNRVTRFVTRFDGDHSLDTAIVAEQVFGRYTLYTVRLQFASGAEQSLAITAPPGGLQPAMRDMSGDKIPNDLVLSSVLLRFHLC